MLCQLKFEYQGFWPDRWISAPLYAGEKITGDLEHWQHDGFSYQPATWIPAYGIAGLDRIRRKLYLNSVRAAFASQEEKDRLLALLEK